jgi:hypothetical protein
MWLRSGAAGPEWGERQRQKSEYLSTSGVYGGYAPKSVVTTGSTPDSSKERDAENAREHAGNGAGDQGGGRVIPADNRERPPRGEEVFRSLHQMTLG